MPMTCEWFALCGNPATVLVAHPGLGDVPVCERCRARFDLTPSPNTHRAGERPMSESYEIPGLERRTHAERVTQATDGFNMIWQNDQDVYLAVLAEVRAMLGGVPGMTLQTIGRNVKDRVFAWAYGGGWGYSEGWGGATSPLLDCLRYPDWEEGPAPAGYRVSPFSYFLSREEYGYVSEERVGEEALEALDLEGYDPTTGTVK
jgi:hypothetical protein